MFWTDVVDTLPGSGLVGWCLESVFFADTNIATIFIPHPFAPISVSLNLGITAKSQDGQQKGRFGPKSGASHRKILLLPADVLQADLRPSMSVSVNTCFFSLCVPNLFLVQSTLYGRHVSTSFLDPVFGAMMKQACRQTLKSLAAECLVGVRLGRLNFLTPVCVD